jgi:hypothetical protein
MSLLREAVDSLSPGPFDPKDPYAYVFIAIAAALAGACGAFAANLLGLA